MITHEIEVINTWELSVAMTGDVDATLRALFNHSGPQEDLTFALWRPSHGSHRCSMVLGELLLPAQEERILDGNVAFTSDYLSRALASLEPGCGLALIHSHLGPGWQDMSHNDIVAERDRLAAAVSGRTGLPLLGMTWGTDGIWGARVWGRSAPFTYERVEVPTVRVASATALTLSFHPELRPEPPALPTQEATLSVWGARAQADITRTRIGIVGLGSVGSLVAEGLSRVGFSDLVIIDHDHIEVRNLDRTLHATWADAAQATSKVAVAERGLKENHTATEQSVTALATTLLSRDGLLAALDCDAIVCCVDRPWPRWVLNTLAYGHVIPIVDGGILARTKDDGRPLHIDWRIHTVGPGRACLVCLGALLRSDVGLDRDGLLDDPEYIAGLSRAERERYGRRNVFPFSMSVAAHEILQLTGMIANSSRVSGIGPQHYMSYPGVMNVSVAQECAPDCEFRAVVARTPDLASHVDE